MNENRRSEMFDVCSVKTREDAIQYISNMELRNTITFHYMMILFMKC